MRVKGGDLEMLPTNPEDGDVFLLQVNGKAEMIYSRENGKWVEVNG